MSTTTMDATTMLSKNELLNHWLGHRNLTRKTIEKFPEKELFSYSIGGMRSFADLTKEIISLAVPGLKEIVTQKTSTFSHDLPFQSKAELLQQWDEDTPKIVEYFNQVPESRLHDKHKLFGQYEFSVINHILYFIDNEIHHRGQGFVYLRSLGIEPPFFWDRF